MYLWVKLRMRPKQARAQYRERGLGSFGSDWAVPSVFWFVGGIDPDMYAKAKKEGRIGQILNNHNPRFAPVIHPDRRGDDGDCRASLVAAITREVVKDAS